MRFGIFVNLCKRETPVFGNQNNYMEGSGSAFGISFPPCAVSVMLGSESV